MADDDATKYTYSFASATYELAEAMAALDNNMMNALNTSKTWTIISRMTSGSDFWKLQNKIKAVTDMFVLYNKQQKKAIENSKGMIKQIVKQAKITSKIPTALANNNIIRKSLDGPMAMSMEERKQLFALQEQDDYIALEKFFVGNKTGKKRKEGKDTLATIVQQQVDMQKYISEQTLEKLEYQNIMAHGTKAARRKARSDKLIKNLKGLVTGFKNFLSVTLPAFFTAAYEMFLFVGTWGGIALAGLVVVLAQLRWMRSAIKDGADALGWQVPEVLNYVQELGKMMFNLVVIVVKIVGYLLTGEWRKALDMVADNIEGGILHVLEMQKKLILGIIKTAIMGLTGWIRMIVKAIKGIADWLGGGISGWIGNIGKRKNTGIQIGSYAAGGLSKGGMTMVGESGPEMMFLPAGARIQNSPHSRRGGASVNVYVNGRVGASDAEINDIAQKVGRAINIQMNRSSNTGVRF